MKIKDIFIALLVPIILGFGFVIAKPAMQYFPPYLLMGLRFTIPALMLVWWFPLPKGLYFDLFKVSLIGSTLQYGLTYTGLNIIDASSAVLLVMLEVPFGIIIAFIIFFLNDIASVLGQGSNSPPEIAAWIPALIPLLLSASMLLYLEES